MPDNLKKRRPQDAERINLSQPYEVEYWTNELRRTEQELRDAVHNAGDSVAAVKRYLQNH